MSTHPELEITVVIPTIPPRGQADTTTVVNRLNDPFAPKPAPTMLERALKSVERQALTPNAVIVEPDPHHTGAAPTRQRGLERVQTEFVAFLDDDDELLPHHLKALATHLQQSGADVVYPWFTVEGGTDPFPGRFGADFNADLLRESNYIPINVLARTEQVLEAGGFQARPNERGWQNEDWRLWLALLDQGRTFSHLPAKTWTWHHHANNTSGNPERWT